MTQRPIRVIQGGIFGQIAARAGAIAMVGLLGFLMITRIGCGNSHTPPGHEGYIRSRPIASAGAFVGIQRGPTSTGWVWRQEVVNIDMRQRTFSELMSIVTAERLELSFRAHARIQLRPGSVKDVVETFGGENWYVANVRDQFRSTVRAEVQSLEAFEVNHRIGDIAARVLTAMQARYKDTPIEFVSVDIGDINYPEVVVQSVVRKFVTNEDNERRDMELRIAQRQIDIGIAEAEGIADAQKIIRTTLDPMFLQYEALGAIEALAGSPNTTFIISPVGKGGAPTMLIQN
jgi:hypothetical protein